jgi:hypothetical protein
MINEYQLSARELAKHVRASKAKYREDCRNNVSASPQAFLELRNRVRALHIAIAFLKGQKFTQPEQEYHNSMVFADSVQNERFIKQQAAIKLALKFISADPTAPSKEEFKLWLNGHYVRPSLEEQQLLIAAE